MLPISFPQSNLTFTKPEGWEDNQCMDLPVWKGEVPIDERGTKCTAIISRWKLSKEDMEMIAQKGEIWLSITGNSMPPVALFTENPFEHGQVH